jgi:hypothetical protein
MARDTLPKLMDAREVGRLLRCSAERVRQLARAGEIPSVRLTDSPKARVRFRRDDVRRIVVGSADDG